MARYVEMTLPISMLMIAKDDVLMIILEYYDF